MISDKDLWDFANDLLDAWNIEDTNEPSLIEDFRDRFVARFQSAPLPADAFAPEVEERIQEYLRPANGNPQRALRLAVLDLMEMHRGPKACGICGRSYPHAHPTDPHTSHTDGGRSMSVYAEWYWACQLCDDRAEEPWGDEQAARDEHDDHMRTYHPTDPGDDRG